MNIGERIKKRRKELEITADELADMIGKSRATVYRYENGDIEDMPYTVIGPLAEALKTTPDYLMGWDDDPNDYDSDDFGFVDARAFDGDVKKQLAFQEAVDRDAMSESLDIDISEQAQTIATRSNSSDDLANQPQTIAAHFDGSEYTEEELEEIKQFAAFIKNKRK